MLSGTVSKTRAMACNVLADASHLDPESPDARSIQLGYLSAPQDTSPICSLNTNLVSPDAYNREETLYLGSLGPHQTPTPAVAPRAPLDLHAPSEYTISTVVFLGAAILGG